MPQSAFELGAAELEVAFIQGGGFHFLAGEKQIIGHLAKSDLGHDRVECGAIVVAADRLHDAGLTKALGNLDQPDRRPCPGAV